MRWLITASLFAASLLLVGCASMANTPAQDRGYVAYERCKHLLPPEARFARIDAQGVVWIASRNTAAFAACYRGGGS